MSIPVQQQHHLPSQHEFSIQDRKTDDTMSSITTSSAQSARSDTLNRTTSQRASSMASRQTSATAGAHSAADDPDYDEEGGYEGEDGDDDDEEAITVDQGQEMLNETTVKSGYLYKRGEKRKNWKKRWFVLRSCKLYYYKNEKEYQLLRFIDMTEVHTIAAVALKKVEHVFGISTSKRQYYVRASNAKEMQSWVDALRDVREQVRQRSTITRDMAALDISSPAVSSPTEAGAGNQLQSFTAAAGGATQPQQQQQQQHGRKQSAPGSSSPHLLPKDHSAAMGGTLSSGSGTTQSAPISIVIPGKGTYSAPAQPRATGSGIVLSPLSATSDSEMGGPSGAEQFGLSYTSSAGQSLASSPGRAGFANQQHHVQHGADAEKVGGHSLIGTGASMSDDGGDFRRSRIGQRTFGIREASVGSSGGEGAGATTAAGSGFSMGRRRSSSQQAFSTSHQSAQVLSSSEEEGDGEGDEWDEDEEADRAMPLPGTGGLGLTHAHSNAHLHAAGSGSGTKQDQYKYVGQQTGDAQQQHQQAQPQQQYTKPKVDPEFFKDSRKIIHQGYLMKQSNRRKHWRKRWFVLTSSNLSYTRSHMDEKASRQIPLSSILDAIEHTSKKAVNHQGNNGAPLSPSLSAFGASAASLQFGRSPLLGGGAGAGGGGGDTASSTNADKQQLTTTKGGASTAGAAQAASSTSEAEQGGTGGASAFLSGNESEGGAIPTAGQTTMTSERRVSVAPNQPTAASQLAAERQNSTSSTTTQHSTPAKKKKENCFKIITPKRVYVVCAPTEEEELKWLSALQALLAHYQDQSDITPVPTVTGSGVGSTHDVTTPQHQQQQQSQPIQQQQISNRSSSPLQSPLSSLNNNVVSPTGTQSASNSSASRLNPPSISLSKPLRRSSQDDTHGVGSAAN